MKWPRQIKHVKVGGAVAAVAQPLARVIDRVVGTDIEHCAGCTKRREMLNNLTTDFRRISRELASAVQPSGRAGQAKPRE